MTLKTVQQVNVMKFWEALTSKLISGQNVNNLIIMFLNLNVKKKVLGHHDLYKAT